MRNILIYVGLILFLAGCSLIPASGKRYKNQLTSDNGRNINDLIKRTEANEAYKIENKGKYKRYYQKVIFRDYNLAHTSFKMVECRYIYITTVEDIIVDNIIQTPQTCKSGFSGVF